MTREMTSMTSGGAETISEFVMALGTISTDSIRAPGSSEPATETSCC
ncbi:MAG: hypothetical protein CHACPFDD_03349 [Phycisphaerae bacterium]|nr:hypothetical protein [Phycisphaerae bacterium]